MNDNDTLIGIFVGIVFGAVASFFLTSGITISSWKTETVERNLAQYCPKDGKWAWKDECP